MAHKKKPVLVDARTGERIDFDGEGWNRVPRLITEEQYFKNRASGNTKAPIDVRKRGLVDQDGHDYRSKDAETFSRLTDVESYAKDNLLKGVKGAPVKNSARIRDEELDMELPDKSKKSKTPPKKKTGGSIGYRSGGKVKSSASKRADGCIIKGRTRGKMC